MSDKPSKQPFKKIALATLGITAAGLAHAYYISLKENRSLKSRLIENNYLPLLGLKRKLHQKGHFNPAYFNSELPTNQTEVPESWQQEFHLMRSHRFSTPTYIIQGDNYDVSKIVIYIFGSTTSEKMTYTHWQFLDNFTNYMDSLIYIPQLPSPLKTTATKFYATLTEYYQSVLEVYKPEDIILLGDSIGATAAFGFINHLRDVNLPQPMHVAMISPILDAEFNNEQIQRYEPFDPVLNTDTLKNIMKNFAGDLPINSSLISPIYSDLKGLASLSIVIGGDEILIPDARAFVYQANQQRHRLSYQELANMFHTFQLFDLPETYAVYDALGMFIVSEVDYTTGQNTNVYNL